MAEVTVMRTPAEISLAQQFEAAKVALPGDLQAREQAFRLFAERGLPHRRVEEFKYTDLRALMREAAPLADQPTAEQAVAIVESAKAFADVEAAQFAIVNGYVFGDLFGNGQPLEGVEITSLVDALANAHPLLAQMSPVENARANPIYQLNSAFMIDGAIIRVAAGTTVEMPLHLRFVNDGAKPFSTATRVLVVVEEGASVCLIESHEGPDGLGYQPNDVVEIVAGDRAKVRHVRLNAEGDEALALSTLTAKLGAHVSFNTINVVTGSGVARHQVFLTFAGEHATGAVNGAAMLKGKQHSDTTLLVDHAVPCCDSRELFKTVIDDTATGVFQGKIIVRPYAQKTDGRMMSGALLLSDGGTMNNKPELEIFADDVQCGHGATCGALDEDLLFYLMARGLPRKEAESLMVQAFLGEAIETVEHEGTREALVAVVEGWLRARRYDPSHVG
jgi:Fe-S cluster assembly protein SufD